MNIELVRAQVADAQKIWSMQKEAFDELLKKYQDFDTNPANESLEKVKYRLEQDDTYYYFIRINDEVIGAVRVVDKNDSSNKKISPIFILPRFQNNGYGQFAMKSVEEIHGEHGWELATVLQESRDCYFYEKMGYSRTGAQIIINEKMTIVGYAK
ncbi:GNAT family N-acetyltransferase [Paenibacillus sp. MABNR03]|uniref:GNAT family N-acetyltransferase n=1 Tax=Paenibacillus sp. MABNR03 TaxID=3142626 RepID=UPI003D2A3517